MATVRSFRLFGILVQRAGPYLLLELLLPGGTLFALLLYVYRKQRLNGEIPGYALMRWSGRLLCRFVAMHFPATASIWRGRHRERDGLEAMAF